MSEANLRAVLSSETYNIFAVLLRYVDTDDQRMYDMPSISIPCSSYAHARAVALAYNNPPQKD